MGAVAIVLALVLGLTRNDGALIALTLEMLAIEVIRTLIDAGALDHGAAIRATLEMDRCGRG